MKQNKIPIWIVGIVIAAVLLVSAYLLSNQNKTQTNSEVSGDLESSSASIGTKDGLASPESLQYIDGEYTAQGEYISPGGKQIIELKINVKNGLVSTVSLSGVDSDLESTRYQQKFNSKLSNLVVGRKIDAAYVTGRVNGSSLTAEGFNNALDSIIEQAQTS